MGVVVLGSDMVVRAREEGEGGEGRVLGVSLDWEWLLVYSSLRAKQ